MTRGKTLITCLKGLLELEDRMDCVRKRDVDWIVERLLWHKLLPMAAALAKPDTGKPAALQSILDGEMADNAVREENYRRQAARTFSLLSDAGIMFVPYKGPFWSSDIYPSYRWKHVGDIDLLMTREDARKAYTLLVKSGYLPDAQRRPKNDDVAIGDQITVFPARADLGDAPVQMHWRLMPSRRFAHLPLLDMEDFFAESSHAEWQGIPFQLPNPEIRFVYYALHATCQHQFKRFSAITTLAHFTRKHIELDWDRIGRFAVDRQCVAPVRYSLLFTGSFTPLPDAAGDLAKRLDVPPITRIAAGFLRKRDIVFATNWKGKYRRKLFRYAMSRTRPRRN